MAIRPIARLAIGLITTALAVGGCATHASSPAEGRTPATHASGTPTTDSNRPRVGSWLYFRRGTHIMRTALNGPTVARPVATVGTGCISSIAANAGFVFWATLVGPECDPNSAAQHASTIYEQPLTGNARPKELLAGAEDVSLAVLGGYLYWGDQNNAIGRIDLATGQAAHSFFTLSPSVAAVGSMATDGHRLFFSECSQNDIGSARPSGPRVDEHLIHLRWFGCPQGLAAASGTLFWTQCDNTRAPQAIGSASVSGGDVRQVWLQTRTPCPTYIAADGSSVFWVHSATPTIGRYMLSGGHVTRSYITGDGPLAIGG